MALRRIEVNLRRRPHPFGTWRNRAARAAASVGVLEDADAGSDASECHLERLKRTTTDRNDPRSRTDYEGSGLIVQHYCRLS